MVQRMDSIEKAVIVAHENLVRIPTEVDKAVGHLREVTNQRFDTTHEVFSTHLEMFSSVQKQFIERDERIAQTSKDSKLAIDAALQAAKEAVGERNDSFKESITKSELGTNKLLDALGLQISALANAMDGKINDMKDRLNRIEGQYVGQTTQKAEQVTSSSSWVSMLSLIVAFVVGVGGIVVAIMATKGG